MPLPVRCFTCGRVLGLKWERYYKLLQAGCNEQSAMDQVGIPKKQYCCRALMLTTVDDTDKVSILPVESTESFTFQSQQQHTQKPRYYDAV